MAVHVFNFYGQNFLNLTFNGTMCEKYGTAVQETADNIIQRMRFACSVPSATDTRCEYVMIIAFGYMKALNVTLDLLISLSG
jgi:hypothetical protein